MNLLSYYNKTPRTEWQSLGTPQSSAYYREHIKLWLAPLHKHSATELDSLTESAQCHIIVLSTGSLITDCHSEIMIPANHIDGGIFGFVTNYTRFDHDIRLAVYHNP